MIGMIVVLAWMVLATAIYFLNAATRDVTTLSASEVPQMVQLGELSDSAADLAALTTRIVSTNAADPAMLNTLLRRAITRLEGQLRQGLPGAQGPHATDQLLARLGGVIGKLDKMRRLDSRLSELVEALRWINVDIQDEVDPFRADFNFNIGALTHSLVRAGERPERARLAATLEAERTRRARIAQIGDAASNATTLAIQGAATNGRKQLSQVSDLISDTLVRINALVGQLEDKPEYLTLRQSVAGLNRLGAGPQSIIDLRGDWLGERAAFISDLDRSLALLADLRATVQGAVQTQRDAIGANARALARRDRLAMQILAGMTVLAGLAGLGILFVYIRPRIIAPLGRLTAAMRAIAAGQSVSVPQGRERDEIGRLSEAVRAFQDSVQERDQALDKLRLTQSELVQAAKMASLGNLSAGISHELNQPLNAIRQRLHLAQAATGEDKPDLRRQIEKIGDLVTRMERIIAHLRRFARRSDYRRESLEVAPMLRNAASLLDSKIAGRAISLDLGSGAPGARTPGLRVCGDQILIEQVLLNLLSNAVDAIVEAGGAGRVSARVERRGEKVAIIIEDDGAGLGDLSPEAAIEPFRTTKKAGHGIGLGLSISYNIITGMGGDLQLEARRTRGTRAIVRLPGAGEEDGNGNGNGDGDGDDEGLSDISGR